MLAWKLNQTEAMKRGLMVEIDGESRITDSGLFAIAGMMANDPETENQEYCRAGLKRAIDAAVAGGFPQDVSVAMMWAFSEGIDPCDDSTDGLALAAMCREVARCTGPGRIGILIEGAKLH